MAKKRQTVGGALAEKRRTLAGKVGSLVLCKRELFYLPKRGAPEIEDDSVYPASAAVAEREAKFFGVEWSEQ